MLIAGMAPEGEGGAAPERCVNALGSRLTGATPQELLHTRVLRDFFFTTHSSKGVRTTRDTDIVAVDYFASASSWPFTSQAMSPYLQQTKERMDETLAHLTFGRLKYNGDNKAWDIEKMRSEIGDKWLEFIDALQKHNEPATDWFLHQAKRLGLPVIAPF